MKAIREAIRGALSHVRHRTNHATRFASRFTRITRYGLDLMLWSRLFDRRLDAVPIELARTLLSKKHLGHVAPTLHVADASGKLAVWEEGFAGVYATLLLNLNNPDTLSPVRYAHPAPSFRGVYLWDSAFIARVWQAWDPAVARDVTQAVLDLRDGDRLQHVVAEFTESVYTQPPVLAWAIAQIAHASRPLDRELLAQAYDTLVAYQGWLAENRRLPSGLYAWAHPYESGIDNSPRFSNVDESRFADTTVLAAPDFSSYVVLQLESLGQIAGLLGREEADAHLAEADTLRAAINESLWCDRAGLYFDRHEVTGEFVRRRTIASLLPLWAGVPDAARAQRLRDHALDPASFGTPIPLPSVARDDPTFVKDMWCGPVWLNTAYAVVEGLARYGFYEAAGELAYRLCDGVFKTFEQERRFFEFYDPDHRGIEDLQRKRGNRWKHLTLGAKPVGEFIGWTGLVNTLVVNVLVGLRHEGGRRTLRPLLPPELDGVGLSVRLPAEELAVTVERHGDRILATIRTPGGVARREAALGQPIDIDPAPPGRPAAGANGATHGDPHRSEALR
ncbi:trehalase family glycosidase [Botrimarina sp.]|uniref:MGH1-like glycoside hydrolase domain-containing protein n=1 Tax=Botrimarina sp. TaxID=2795802 RepID=UPI0032F04C5E